MGFVNQNGDVVDELGGAVQYPIEQAFEAASALAAQLERGLYILPLLFGEIDVDAHPIYVPVPPIEQT